MKQEHDEYLCKTFPRMFVNRHAPMTETCMCWGFDCGDGWYNIIRALCGNIQSHINWQRRNRANSLQYNRCLQRALNGDKAGLVWYYTYSDIGPTEYTFKQVDEAIANPKFRNVPEKVAQVIVDQVKEKFGTLRFYYHGGDDKIDGMVQMAESMSACTCEGCGAPASVDRTSTGWITTLCEGCAEAREKRRMAYHDAT